MSSFGLPTFPVLLRYLLMQTKLTSLSFPSLNNLLRYLRSTADSSASLYFPLFGSQKNPGSLEVACSNGFLAFCFMSYSPTRHLLLPAALGCVVKCSLRSFSSDRSNTLNRSSFARDSMMIEEILAPTKDTVRSISCLPFHSQFLFS